MAFEPLSANKQYAIGGADQFPNKSIRYKTLSITPAKSRKDQKESRRIEALTGRDKTIQRKVNAKDPKTRKRWRKAVNTILSHQYDQSILASEKGSFPSLPKSSVVDMDVPPKGLTTIRNSKKRKISKAKLNSKLYNSFVPSNFQQQVDLQISTPAITISGREQPYGGTEGTIEQIQVPRFLPNAAYGGTAVRYR